MAAISVS